MIKSLGRFFREDTAATAVEYAVVLGLILLVMITAIAMVGAKTGGMWGGIENSLRSASFIQ